MPIIRHVYKNPRHTVQEDYELIPSLVQEEGYEDINMIVSRLTRGELVDVGRGRTQDDPFDGLLDKPIEEVYDTLEEIRTRSLSEVATVKDLENSEAKRSEEEDFTRPETVVSSEKSENETSKESK